MPAKKAFTVLLVEDDYPAGEAMAHLLKRRGCEVVRTRKGEEAVELAFSRRPDVVILDLKLAGRMDGYGVLGAFKKDSRLASIPVVIVTNYGLIQDVARGLASGADDYLVKSDHSIYEIIERVMRHVPAGGGG